MSIKPTYEELEQRNRELGKRLCDDSPAENQKHYRKILNCSPSVIYTKDLEGRYTYTNKEFENLSGLKSEDVIGKTDFDLFPPLVAKNSIKNDKQVIQTGVPLEIEEYGPVDGKMHSFISTKYPLLDEWGKIYGVCCVSKDITIRSNAEQELKNKDKLFRKAITHSPTAMVVSEGIDQNVIMLNDRFIELFGYAKEDIPDVAAWWLLAYPDEAYREKIRTIWTKAVEKSFHEQSQVEPMEVIISCKDGTLKEVSIEAASVGEINLVTFFDMTERNQAIQALKESKNRLELIYHNAQVGLGRVRVADGKVIECNEKMAQIFGYDDTSKFVDEYIFSDNFVEKDLRENFVTKLKINGSLTDLEEQFYRKTGEKIWVRFDSKIFPEQGYIEDVMIDITEQKESQINLQKAKDRLESLWNITKIADSDTKTIYNHVLAEVQKITQSKYAFYGFFDKNQKDLILHAWSHETMEECRTNAHTLHFPIDKAGIWAEAVRDSKVLTINDFSLDHPGKKGTPDGHVQLTRLLAVPITKEDKVISIVAIANKETEYTREDEEQVLAFMRNVQLLLDRKTAQREAAEMATHLQQAQKLEAVGTLAGGIAHDFNNILGAILGYAEMVQDDCPPGSTMRNDIDRVVEAGHRAKELVKQILAFSRQTESDEQVLQPALIIKEATKMLRASLPRTIDIQQNIDPEAGLILADPTQIHQIITNLCTNAFHAMEETGGILNISLKNKELALADLVNQTHVQPGHFVEISVGDTGPGIAPELMDKIFDPFFTTKEIGKGTGMGLAIIHGIAKKAGGFVVCKSSPGQGATFLVYLQVHADTALPEAEATPAEPAQTGFERILFIDDEEMLAEMGKTMLERLGYRVTVKTNSIEALKIIQNQPDSFDLIITDQTMPGMTGSDLARRTLQIRPKLPIILCTGFSNQISEEKAKIYGIKGFAMKPLAIKDLATLVRKVLDGEKPKEQ